MNQTGKDPAGPTGGLEERYLLPRAAPSPPGRPAIVWVLAVLAICVIGAAVTLSILGGFKVVQRVEDVRQKARTALLRSDLLRLKNLAEMYMISNARYPKTLDEVLHAKDLNGVSFVEQDEEIKDPWGRDYIYSLGPDGKPRVRCLGKDGREGGEGEDRDFEEPEPAVEQR